MNRYLIIAAAGLVLLIGPFALGQSSLPPLIFPQVVDGGGYVTTFTFTNIGVVPVTGSLVFFNQDGTFRVLRIASTVNSSLKITIPAKGSLRVSTAGNGAPAISGWALFDSPVAALSAIATYDLRSNGTLISSVGIPPVTPQWNSRVVLPIDATDSTDSGVAIVNPSSVTIGVNFLLSDETGNQVATSAQAIGPNHQIAALITSLFNVTLPFKGSIIVETSGASFAATGLAIKEGVLSALPITAAPIQDIGLPSTPVFGIINGDANEGPARLVYRFGVDAPGPSYGSVPPQNWNQISYTEVQISTDPTFSNFPAKQSLKTSYPGAPPWQGIFSTDYAGIYHARARVINQFGQSQWTALTSWQGK
jgi:hypothetical protein